MRCAPARLRVRRVVLERQLQSLSQSIPLSWAGGWKETVLSKPKSPVR